MHAQGGEQQQPVTADVLALRAHQALVDLMQEAGLGNDTTAGENESRVIEWIDILASRCRALECLYELVSEVANHVNECAICAPTAECTHLRLMAKRALFITDIYFPAAGAHTD